MVALGNEISQLKSAKELVGQEATLKSSAMGEMLLEIQAKNEQMLNLEETCKDLQIKLDESSTRVQNLEASIESLENFKRQSEEEREKLTKANNELKESVSRYVFLTNSSREALMSINACHQFLQNSIL